MCAGEPSPAADDDTYGNDDFDPGPEPDDPCDFDWDSDSDYNVPENDSPARFR